MANNHLYQVRSVEQLSLLENNATPTPAQPRAYYTIHHTNVSAGQYGYIVYAGKGYSFVGYADVENPTANQIRSQF